jgi:hypothetical protein
MAYLKELQKKKKTSGLLVTTENVESLLMYQNT